jgi:hypothetical protein
VTPADTLEDCWDLSCWVAEVRNIGLVVTGKCAVIGLWNIIQWNLHLRSQETAAWNTILRRLLINSLGVIEIDCSMSRKRWTKKH